MKVLKQRLTLERGYMEKNPKLSELEQLFADWDRERKALKYDAFSLALNAALKEMYKDMANDLVSQIYQNNSFLSKIPDKSSK